MSVVGFSNINALTAKCKRERERIEMKATEYVQRKAVTVLNAAVRISPTWSGNYAANWVLETSATGAASYNHKFKVEPWQSLQNPWNVRKRGDPAILNWNRKYINEDTIKSIKWNSRVKLANYAPVAEMIEAGTVKLRPVNAIPGDAGVMAYLQSKFNFLR